jgi:hypothetical protein
MRTDYVYGWKAFNEKNGFTSAQGSMNVPETVLYFYYLYIVYSQGTQLKVIRGGVKPGFLAQRYVDGQPGALAAAVGFAAAVMTLSKTLLYGALPFQLCARLDYHLRSQDSMKLSLAGVMWGITSGLIWSFCGLCRSEFFYILCFRLC